MTERQPNDWIWTALIAAASSVAAMLAVWFMVNPQLIDPSATLRRDSERQQLTEKFRQELRSEGERQREFQQQQFEAATKRIEKVVVDSVDGAVERATQRQLSETFLDELRARLLDQARQAGSTAPPSPIAASAAIDAMLLKDLATIDSAKAAINETWASVGAPPASNEAAGLPPPAAFARQFLRSLTVRKDGSVYLAFDPRIGVANAGVLLVPEPQKDSSYLSWRCSTNIPGVLRVIPLCELRSRLPQ